MSEERLGEGEREGSLKRDLGEEDLGCGAGELGNRSEWRPMEGSKESADEEDGRQGGRGIQVGSGVGFSFQMCFPWGGGGFVDVSAFEMSVFFVDMEGKGSGWRFLLEEGERFYLLLCFFNFLRDEISVLDRLFYGAFKV